MGPEKPLDKKVKLEKNPKAPEAKEGKDKVPATKVEAKKAVKKEVVVAKKEGSKKISKAREAKPKPKITTLTICGKQVERRIVGGKVTFVEKGKKAPIGDFGSWVENEMKDKELQKQIDSHLKPYSSQIKQLDEKKQSEVVKKINDTKFSKLEFGKVDVYGQEIEDPVKKAAYLTSVIAKKTNSRKFTVSQKSLDSIKHKPYLDYQHILPTNVRTIVITRGGKKMVCSRAMSGPTKGGRVSYVDVSTGKRMYLKGGDGIQIVGTVSASAALSIQKTEQAYAKVRSKAGKIWMKDSDRVVDFNPKPVSSRTSSGGSGGYGGGGGGGYSGGGGGGGYSSSGGSPSSIPSSSGGSYPTGAPSKLASSISSITETPEAMKEHCTQETFRVPGKHMFASMLSPNLKKYPKLAKSKPKLVMYFAGRGYYDTITKWVRKNGRTNPPPASVLAQAAREDFLSSKKRLFATCKARWAKGENVHFALVSHMRNFISSDEKISGSGGNWYNELWKSAPAKALFSAITSKFRAKSGAKVVKDITAVGHSMGGKAIAGISKLKAKGELPYNFSYFSSDASYWYMKLDEVKKNPKISLYLSFRPGSKTAKVAQSVVKNLALKGYRRGKETVFTNSKYPNVRVVASSTSHGAHPGEYLNAALELDKKSKTA